MPQRRKNLTPERQKALEDELIDQLAAGKELSPGAAELVSSPEFAQRVALRKQELASQSAALTQHCLSSSGMASLAIAAIL